MRYRKYANAYRWNLVEQPADVYVVRPPPFTFIPFYTIIFVDFYFIQINSPWCLTVVIVVCGCTTVNRDFHERKVGPRRNSDGRSLLYGARCVVPPMFVLVHDLFSRFATGVIKQLGETSVGIATMVRSV